MPVLRQYPGLPSTVKRLWGVPFPVSDSFLSFNLYKKASCIIPNAHLPQKKEIAFPPDSVEAAEPLLVKRRRLNKSDVDPVDPWRLMMSLKSGLLAESTWALDTLNILLYDDVTVMYFGLSHLPGLLEVLLEHFRRCLIEMFGEFEDVEIIKDTNQSFNESDDSMLSEKSLSMNEKVNENDEKIDEPVKEEISARGEEKKGESENSDSKSDISVEPDGAKSSGIHANYTYVTRRGVSVKLVDDEVGASMLQSKVWDIYSGFCTKPNHFHLGGGDTSRHILTYFESLDEYNIGRKLFYSARKMTYKDEDESSVGNHCESETDQNNLVIDDGVDKETDEFEKISEAVTEKSKENSFSLNMKGHTCNNYINKIHIKKECNIETEQKSIESSSDMKIDVKKEPVDISDNVSMKLDKDLMSSDVKPDATLFQNDNLDKEEKMDVKVKEQFDKEAQLEIPDKISEKTLQLITSKSDQEDEAYQKDQYPLNLISTAQDELGRRCICISNIFRSLSCVPGNDGEMSKHPGLVYILGKLLLLHHTHLPRSKVCRKLEHDDELEEPVEMDQSVDEWWWDYLNALRENTLVIFANICGKLDLSKFPQEVCLPVLDGLLHWAVCPSACATDPLPTVSPNSVLSPQRLVLEALCKLCIHESNVDLLLAAPPFQRIVQLFGILGKLLSNKSEPVTQEFAIVLLSELVEGDSSAARAVALQHPCISLLIDFLEAAEQKAVQVAHLHGINTLRDNPEIMGTSLDMLRRAANILLHLSQVPQNRTLFVHHQSRLLSLVMSQILDQLVAQIVSDVLFHCSDDLL